MNNDLTFEAEKALIGSLLKAPKQIELVHDILTRDDFLSDVLRWTWDAMLSLR